MSSLRARQLHGAARFPIRAINFAMRELQVSRLIKPRRIDVCCCGLSKTGTHSLAGIFENYRSQHHPDAKVRLPLSIAMLRNEIGVEKATKILKSRDRKMWLEMESSTLSGILIEPMIAACPDKKFILTLRDVYSWCDSWINHNLNKRVGPPTLFDALDRIRLRADEFPPGRHDAPLTELGFPSLAAYFQLWSRHNRRVLDAVPSERLLILRTGDINGRMEEIAKWVGAGSDTLRTDRSWLAPTRVGHGILARMDPSYVQDTAMKHCGDLMERHFPGASFKSFAEQGV